MLTILSPSPATSCIRPSSSRRCLPASAVRRSRALPRFVLLVLRLAAYFPPLFMPAVAVSWMDLVPAVGVLGAAVVSVVYAPPEALAEVRLLLVPVLQSRSEFFSVWQWPSQLLVRSLLVLPFLALAWRVGRHVAGWPPLTVLIFVEIASRFAASVETPLTRFLLRPLFGVLVGWQSLPQLMARSLFLLLLVVALTLVDLLALLEVLFLAAWVVWQLPGRLPRSLLFLARWQAVLVPQALFGLVVWQPLPQLPSRSPSSLVLCGLRFAEFLVEFLLVWSVRLLQLAMLQGLGLAAVLVEFSTAASWSLPRPRP